MIVENKVQTNQEQIKGFQEGDTDTPIYMLNLLKSRNRQFTRMVVKPMPPEKPQTYAGEVGYVKKVGGKMIFGGQVSRLMPGEVEDLWDSVVWSCIPVAKPCSP